METTLVIVGKALKINKLFLDYIDSHVYLHVDTPERKIFLDKNNKNIFSILEDIMNESSDTLIIASEDSFNLVNKIIATLNEDVLELKEGMLIPSKTNRFAEGSYLLEKENKNINVLKAKINDELPRILIEKEDSVIFSLIGLDEDSTKILLEPLANTYEIKLTSTQIVEGWSYIEASTYKYGELGNFLKAVRSLFPDKFIPRSNVLEHIILSLDEAEKSVTVAESCTGGLIASMLTSISGSSNVFNGSIVSYSNTIKQAWLSVDSDTIKSYGAVSELCVREMMEGVLSASSSDFAMATSGIAGPTGGSEEKPVGTVFVGARGRSGNIIVERLLLKGSREYIQQQSAYHAIRLLLHVGKDIFFKK